MRAFLAQTEKASVTPESLTELAGAFKSFTEGTQKLKEMYAQLEGRVSYLTEELEKKNRELERANRLASLGQLAAGVAHEIRNPLGGIELCANLLERELSRTEGAAESPDTRSLVCNIVEGVRRMNSIVENLLSFTRESKIAARPVCLNPLVRQAMDALQLQSQRNRVRCVCSDAAAGHVAVQGDPDQLRQVFINIMQNAIEAMPDGGTLAIAFAGTRLDEKGYLCVTITDTGCGIPDEMMDKVFNPFFTTKDAGTGLGLAIVHRIVENHNGRISVESRMGRGTAVKIFLPCEFNGA